MATRLPILTDRPGLRWLLNGKVMPGGPLVLLTHRGRRTARTYTTPLEVLVEDEDKNEIILTPMRGERSDWCRNVLAGGAVKARFRGQDHAVHARSLSEDESGDALTHYQRQHPTWSRLVLAGMARTHRVTGDRVAALAKSAPFIALTIIPERPRSE